MADDEREKNGHAEDESNEDASADEKLKLRREIEKINLEKKKLAIEILLARNPLRRPEIAVALASVLLSGTIAGLTAWISYDKVQREERRADTAENETRNLRKAMQGHADEIASYASKLNGVLVALNAKADTVKSLEVQLSKSSTPPPTAIEVVSDSERREAQINIQWLQNDSGAQRTYRAARARGLSIFDAILSAQGHNPRSQEVIRKYGRTEVERFAASVGLN